MNTRLIAMRCFRSLCAALLLGFFSLGLSAPAQSEPVSFRHDLAQVLLDNCLACHGPKKAEGGYRVDSYERVMAEGDSGTPGFYPEDLESSEAFRRIMSDDPDERMPLEGEPLTKEQKELLKRWIEEGAAFDGEDPKADLASILPPPVHPDPPEAYPRTMPITAVCFSADGSQLIAGGYHELTVWNPSDGTLLRRIKNVGQRTMEIELSPDGKQLAVGGGAPGKHGETRIFDLESGELVRAFGSTSDVVLDVAFSPDGQRIAVAAADGLVRVFDVAAGSEQLVISSHSDWVMAVAWSDDGSQLATASRDKTAKAYHAETGELLVTYSGHGEAVKGVAFHPDGKEIFSSGGDRKIHRWKIDDGKKSAELGLGGEVYKLNRTAGFLWAPAADKTVRQIDAKSFQEVRKYSGHSDWALSTAFHEGSKRLAAGGFDGSVFVWNSEDGEPVTSFKAAPGLEVTQ